MAVDGLTVGGPAVGRPESAGRSPAGGPVPDAVGGPFLSVAEVARRMQVSKMTIYRLVHSGQLPASRSGRGFQVQCGAVEELTRTARYVRG